MIVPDNLLRRSNVVCYEEEISIVSGTGVTINNENGSIVFGPDATGIIEIMIEAWWVDISDDYEYSFDKYQVIMLF